MFEDVPSNVWAPYGICKVERWKHGKLVENRRIAKKAWVLNPPLEVLRQMDAAATAATAAAAAAAAAANGCRSGRVSNSSEGAWPELELEPDEPKAKQRKIT